MAQRVGAAVRRGLAALLTVATPCVAGAVDGSEPGSQIFSLSGFGTLGLVHSSEELADFGGGFFVPNGAGFTRKLSPEVDSRLGAQLTGTIGSRLSATVQLVAEQRYDGHYNPHVEWANLKYELTPRLSVRAGRTALATFLVADFRKVGYANPWVRPPGEVYGLVPVSSSDGVDATYRIQRGAFVHTLQGSYGQSDARVVGGTKTRGREQWVLSGTMEYDHLTLRVAYQQFRVHNEDLRALFDGFRQFGAQGAAIADRYTTEGKRGSFVGVGGSYDAGKWFLMGEWGTANYRSVIGERTAWYVSGGYRIGAFTPYMTYARSIGDSNASDPGLSVEGLSPQLAGAAAGLNAALNGVLGSLPVQRGIAAGVRWDFGRNVDLKLQIDHNELGAGSPGSLGNLQPGFRPGGTVNLLSATFDFVW